MISPVSVHRAEPRWSRRRGVLSVFAAGAAVAFAAAWVGPLGGAMVDAQAAEIDGVSLYALSADDTQSFATADGEAAAADLDRAGYSVYVTPKPTPTPTPTPSASKDPGQQVPTARPQYTGGGSAAEWMAAAGIAESDQGYVDYIVKRESGWNPNATNKSSGACGLVQALPCSKVPGNGYDPVDNLRWATGYAVGRYGSWASAYDFWINNHWW
ncbi:transglycosylase SLT domain-containing protein [Microbacterium sp. P07]|uniref:aggregation-promoting factor C-terminal-like domain-containing protein n=1 Tax=Microbacterium sp. P07 TaxID=3366952 RepID=UPI0037459D97